MKAFVCRALLLAALALFTSSACSGDPSGAGPSAVKHNGAASIVFSVPKADDAADTRAATRNVLFRLAKAALRQTGQTVTVEVATPVAYKPLPPLPETSGTLLDWLRLLKRYAPSLSWSSSGQAVHVVASASKPYDPFSTKLQTDYSATMTVRQWTMWIEDQLPGERIRIDDTGYGDQGRLNYSTYLQDQVVRLDVKKGTTARQFLTLLAAGYGGTWVADIQDPSNQPKHHETPNGGPLAVRNYTYLFRASDPFPSKNGW